jgi:hypothetical protein
MTISEIKKHAAGLSSLTADHPAWMAVLATIARMREDAIQQVRLPTTTPELRAHFAGALDALEDLRSDLDDLRSGAWANWPGIDAHTEDAEEDKAE